MEPGIERKVVCVTPEDHKYIEELHGKIIKGYKAAAVINGVKPTPGKKGKGHKMRHVINFLREHSVFGDKEIQDFASRFVRNEKKTHDMKTEKDA